MTFSTRVKNELVKIEYEKSCCKKSLLYGMALFSKIFSFSDIVFQTENESTALLYKSLLKEQCNIDCDINVSPSGKTFSIDISDSAVASKLMSFFGHDRTETSLRINVSNLDCEQCRNAFVAGVFLSCGTVSSPEKNYHLEFAIPYMNLSKSFVTLLQEMEIEPKSTVRKGYNIIYFKESEMIEDLLYIMGASQAMFDMMNTKIVKEIRNSANRKANCETANIAKMASAASPQIAAILKIQEKKGLESLPDNLKQIAELRLENPDVSLQEIAQMFEPPISKSGANHRLKRLVQIAQEL